MKLQEYIEYYECELEKLEKHKQALLEINKNVTYTERKISFVQDLIEILNNCKSSERLKDENRQYKYLVYIIEDYFNAIEKTTINNERKKLTMVLIKKLQKEIN